MRLLIADQQGQLKLTKDLGDPLPPYAILSHTWGEDEDEVTFDDIEKGRGVNKIGYAKLKFCMRQALKDDLKYVWVDTCCINKASQTELSKAITSMFKWYQNAAKCYVHLSDVIIQSTSGNVADSAWESLFHGSRWFTRGWTLQELLAPLHLEFFARDGQLLGTKTSLMQHIHSITGIPLDALQAPNLLQFPVQKRLAWAAHRITKEPEDRAYCLIGLCGVSMSLRYGEGENAFRRLEAKIRKMARPVTQDDWSMDTIDHQQRNDNILASLFFPEIDARRQQISPPSAETFQWVLAKPSPHSGLHSSFVSFLQSDSDCESLFWITGIPGSGKSSLMAYLFDRLEGRFGEVLHSNISPKLIASYFFWSPSTNMLQKSVSGMLRTLLYNLFEQNPTGIQGAVTPRRWQHARSQNDTTQLWTESELRTAFDKFTRLQSQSATVLLLIDGLDEIEGSIDKQESLVATLQAIANLPNIKLCVSSRPLPIFADAFGHMPLLRLQDLNYNDISKHVRDTMFGHKYFRALSVQYPSDAENLLDTVCSRAAGVFLWVRLVVRDMLQCLRDGGGFAALKQLLDDVPEDLVKYFQRILDSIDRKYLADASKLLQIALWQERDFISIHDLGLIDLSFTDEIPSQPGKLSSHPVRLDLTADREVQLRLSATFRKLQSRCKGLLLCYYLPGDMHNTVKGQMPLGSPVKSSNAILMEDDSLLNVNTGNFSSERDEFFAFDFPVEFLHRSVRDFLMDPSCIGRLEALTNGPVNVRHCLCTAWLHQAEALMAAGLSKDLVSRLVSHIISAASTPSMRGAGSTLGIVTRLKPIVDYLMESGSWYQRGLYIDLSLSFWRSEQSSFLTFCIDFNIRVYVMNHLTSGQIRNKPGRPLLDYVLRPRFFHSLDQRFGLRVPDPSFVDRMIQLGANPDALYKGHSLLSLFFCFISDFFRVHNTDMTPDDVSQIYDTLALLLQHTSTTQIPRSWLCHHGEFDVAFSGWPYDIEEKSHAQQVLQLRWPNIAHMGDTEGSMDRTSCHIKDLLQNFRPYFGTRTDDLVVMVNRCRSMHGTSAWVSEESS
jgi:hypothetical protein